MTQSDGLHLVSHLTHQFVVASRSYPRRNSPTVWKRCRSSPFLISPSGFYPESSETDLTIGRKTSRDKTIWNLRLRFLFSRWRLKKQKIKTKTNKNKNKKQKRNKIKTKKKKPLEQQVSFLTNLPQISLFCIGIKV